MNKKHTPILFIFVFIKFTLQYLAINPVYELHRDEFLHLDQGKHLAWGYLSVPPVTSWFSYIIILLGNNEFWVKFFPALFGVLTLIIVWHAIKILKGNLFALVLGASAVTFSTLVRMNTLYQPNSFEIMIWTLFFYSLIRFFNSGNNKWILITGFIIGIAFLNKYNIVFVLIALIPAIIISRQAKIFVNKYFYFALLIALVIISPNLYWQYQHHFVVFHHLSTLSKTQLVNVNRIDFIKEQMLFFAGSIFILIASFFSFFTFPFFKKYITIFWCLVFTLAIFIFLKAKGYYAIGLYPIFFAFGSVYLERIFQAKAGVLLRPLSLIIILVFFIVTIKIILPVMSPEEIIADPKILKKIGLMRWEDGKDHMIPQDFADMVGWKELAQKVDSCYSLEPDKEHTAVLCNNYGQAGAINYYSKYKNINAVTQNADYIDWYKLDIPILNVISVKTFGDKDSLRKNEKPYFDSIKYMGEIKNPFSREKGTNIYLFKKPKIDINSILRKEIANTKKEDSE